MSNTVFTTSTGTEAAAERRDEVKFDLHEGREGPATPGQGTITVTSKPADWAQRAGQPDEKWDEQVRAETPGSWVKGK